MKTCVEEICRQEHDNQLGRTSLEARPSGQGYVSMLIPHPLRIKMAWDLFLCFQHEALSLDYTTMNNGGHTFPPAVAQVRHGCSPLNLATVASPSWIVFFNVNSNAGVNCDAFDIVKPRSRFQC